MTDFLLDYYVWIKALHVISVIFWMAALLYLPRLFIYQIEAPAGGELHGALKGYQRLLHKRILNPAMHASWFFAILMLWANPALFSDGWMHVKLTAVVLLTVSHLYFGWTRRRLERDEDVGASRTWRFLNEAPAVLAIVIVFMAIPKPF